MAKLDGTRVRSANITRFDLSFERRYDIENGKGIRLKSPEAFDRKGEKIHDGLQSDFFGTDFSDERGYAERYRCECGYLIGKAYEGELCPKCGSPVEYIQADITKMGYIVLDHFHLMSPIFAEQLSGALGTVDGHKVLDLIMETGFDKNVSDEHTMLMREKDTEIRKKHPFIHKGMIWFYDHFQEVIKYYSARKPGKKKLFDSMINNRDQVFTDSIPVISSIMRSEMPGEKDKRLEKFRINTIYQALIRNSNSINALGDPDKMTPENICTVNRFLCSMHKNILKLFDEIFNILNGKNGTIQSRVIGGRYNFTVRCIISASSGELRANEIEMCYLGFLEFYRYEITNIYTKIMHCTIEEAQQAWHRATVHFDKVIYGIMQYMIAHNQDDIGVLINRNPSINYGSFLYVKIKAVKPDITDKTIRVNTRIITSMNADFDGDQENTFRIIGHKLNKKFASTLDPTYNLYIDRVNGRINKDMMPLKDEVVGFWYFNNCD